MTSVKELVLSKPVKHAEFDKEQGGFGFDNQRENIDPALKTKVLFAQEAIIGSASYNTLNINNLSAGNLFVSKRISAATMFISDTASFASILMTGTDPTIYQRAATGSLRVGHVGGTQWQAFGESHSGFPGQMYFDAPVSTAFIAFRAGNNDSLRLYSTDNAVSIRGAAVQKDINWSGDLSIVNANTGETPSNPVTPVVWLKILIDSNDAWIPLYQ